MSKNSLSGLYEEEEMILNGEMMIESYELFNEDIEDLSEEYENITPHGSMHEIGLSWKDFA